MPENVGACPLCGGAESSLFDRRSFHQQEITNRVCKACGLVYQDPRMSAAELDLFYQAEYRLIYQGQEDPSPKDLAVQRGRAAAALEFTKGRLPQITRHLDIGCSAGLFLQAFQQAYGCQPCGVEPGRAYREYARRQGLAVVAGLEELPVDQRDSYDLVSMMHVLEHIPNPIEYLARLREMHVKPEGRLLLEVPNLYAHDSFETAHLFSFSAQTLAQTVMKAGYEVLAVRKHGLPRSRLIPLYVTVLARPSASRGSSPAFKIVPEKSAGLKRRLGMFYRRVVTRLAPSRAWLTIER